jgi:hypothetical protein
MAEHDSPIDNPNSVAHDFLCDEPWAEWVTPTFFRQVYPNGLRDKVIVLNACAIFLDTRFVRHLASGGGTSVVGWKASPPSNLAERVATSFYAKILKATEESVFETGRAGGNRVLVAWEESFDQLIEDWRAVLPSFKVGPTRSEAVAGNMTPGQADAFDKRVVELVHLVNTEEDRDVEDGDRMTLRGVAGDGVPDSLAVTVDVTGLEAHDDIDRFNLRFHLDGRPVPGSFPLSVPLSVETYRFEGTIPLGQDVRPGERVDLDVAVEIPGGGISRWLYEDLLLMGGCSFAGRISEVRIRQPRERLLAVLGEYHGRAVYVGEGRLFLSIYNRGDAPGYGTPEVIELFMQQAGAAAEVGTLGVVPAQPGQLVLARPNPFHNPSRLAETGPRILEPSSFQVAMLDNRVAGSFDLTTFDATRMAGSFSLPLELAGNQFLFDAEFDAGLRCEIEH